MLVYSSVLVGYDGKYENKVLIYLLQESEKYRSQTNN